MLGLQNFGHMNVSVIEIESRDKNFVGDAMDINYDVITFISKYYFCLVVVSFADIIKIAIMLIKKTFKESIKFKTIRNYSLKYFF